MAFVKKYIQYAKSKAAPVLTKGAADHIVQVYAGLRNEEMEGNKKRTSPLTARTLETLIRLATAHAKARLSTKAEYTDARQAEEIMRFALFREVPKRQRRKKRKLNNGPAAQKGSDDADGSDEESENSGDEHDADAPAVERLNVVPIVEAPSVPAAQRSEDPIWGDDSQDVNMDVDLQQTLAPLAPPDSMQPRPERLQLFRSRMAKVFGTQMQDEETGFLKDILEHINEGLASNSLFGSAEATELCKIMADNDELMISDGIIYKV